MQEQEIIRLLRTSPEEGHRAAFEEYWGYAYTIAYQVLHAVGTREDVEDCTVEALCDALLHFTPSGTSLKAYIGTTARNKAITQYRTLTARPTVSLEEETLPEPRTPEDIAASVEEAELARQVIAEIRALGEPDASIVLCRYYYGRTSGETARILKMNPITVRSRCARAVKRLRKTLADLDITL